MARRIPPFAALRAFEAAARHGNLRRAGEELSLSVSAVSHQIKSLEDFLGVALFLRDNSKMSLTPDGRDYVVDLTQSLDLIANSTARIEKHRQAGQLTINLFHSLAALWLLPRLQTYRRLEPNVDVRVMTTMEAIDFRTGSIDIAIRYATAAPADCRADVLFGEEAFPVCSPAYLEQIGGVPSDGDFSGWTLVGCSGVPREWEEWFESSGFTGKRPLHRVDFDSRSLALDAAADGLGIVMGRTPFVDRALASGRLIRPFGQRVTTGYFYFLAVPERSLRIQAVTSFRKWLIEEAKQAANSPGSG
ncbi:MAG: LysR family transcriptional regulator, glycine cleavage system transcriptional activator [Rhodospirillaceae bacterium]|jgi:LysR family glycine cleavage system transcriptional activator|nr:LysR family transcriptional regulator, glycine cleavage system transcriptional activator [Rhodospirillaceae bacterium]